MMKDVSEHGRKNTVAAKTEHMHADMVQKALLDILTDTGKLFSYKLFYIFNGNTISHFRRELGSFIDEIESLVCKRPQRVSTFRYVFVVTAVSGAAEDSSEAFRNDFSD